MTHPFHHPYPIAPEYNKPVAYFCMEYAIHQPLKLYAGGLGFLAGSYLRSAYDMRQNLIAIGILWKYGYYDQVHKSDQTMDILFEEKVYKFLKQTDIRFTIQVSGHQVHVTALYLPPDIYHTAPLFLLSTDLPENDYLARTICHKLYDSNPETKIAASILLGAGGAKLLECLGWEPEVWHLNESHGLPLAFYLYNRYKNIPEIRKKLVFTSHTPEDGGNPRTDLRLLDKMGFFCGIPLTEIEAIAGLADRQLDHTLTALRLSGLANGVSQLHLKTLQKLWSGHKDIAPIISITNAQNFSYWNDAPMYKYLSAGDDKMLRQRKIARKERLFDIVADECGVLFDKSVLTLVFAKRFTDYKRPDLLLHDMERFERLIADQHHPIQIIWAGKPYPMDYTAIGVFDKIVNLCKSHSNCAILCGYELRLSRQLKQAADIWLNVPRMTHEASGTSGMTAAMNGAINLSLPDGWFPEFAQDKINSFVIPPCDPSLPVHNQDDKDAGSLYDILEKEIIPLYYDYPSRWLEIMKKSMCDISPRFDSNRMADEYFKNLYGQNHTPA